MFILYGIVDSTKEKVCMKEKQVLEKVCQKKTKWKKIENSTYPRFCCAKLPGTKQGVFGNDKKNCLR